MLLTLLGYTSLVEPLPKARKEARVKAVPRPRGKGG